MRVYFSCLVQSRKRVNSLSKILQGKEKRGLEAALFFALSLDSSFSSPNALAMLIVGIMIGSLPVMLVIVE